MQNFDKNQFQKHSIHKILAHSYAAHLVLFLFGVFFDVIFRFKFFTNSALTGIGALFLILGSILIFWAQYTSHHLNKKNITKETFCQGPYCYTRTPTNFGLFFLVFGFGLMISAFLFRPLVKLVPKMSNLFSAAYRTASAKRNLKHT